MSSERTARIEANPEGGRDFVVGDVHGEFPTLEALLRSSGQSLLKKRMHGTSMHAMSAIGVTE